MRPTCFSRRGLARGHILSRRKRCLPADRDHPRPRDADTRRDPHIKPRGTFVLAVSFRPEPSSQHPALIQYKDHKLPQIPKPPVWTRILNSAPQLSRLRLFRLSDGELLRVSDRPDSDRSCLQAVGLHSGGPAHSHRGLAACQSCSFIHRCDITLVTSGCTCSPSSTPFGTRTLAFHRGCHSHHCSSALFPGLPCQPALTPLQLHPGGALLATRSR